MKEKWILFLCIVPEDNSASSHKRSWGEDKGKNPFHLVLKIESILKDDGEGKERNEQDNRA